MGTGGTLLRSHLGNTWTALNLSTNEHLYAITQSPQGLLAVGAGGTVLRSTDGLNWNLENAGTTAPLIAVSSDEQRFFALEDSGGISLIISSLDGITWNQETISNTRLLGLAGSTFARLSSKNQSNPPIETQTIAVGENGMTLRNSNGTGWQEQPSNGVQLNAALWNQGRFQDRNNPSANSPLFEQPSRLWATFYTGRHTRKNIYLCHA